MYPKHAETGSTGGIPNRSLRNALAMQSLSSADLSVRPAPDANDFVGQATRTGQFSNSDWINRPNGRSGNPDIIQQTLNGVNQVNNFARKGESDANDAKRGINNGLNQFKTSAGLEQMKSYLRVAKEAERNFKNQIALGASSAGERAGLLGRSNPDSARIFSEYAGKVLTGMTTTRVQISKGITKLEKQIETTERFLK